MAGVVAPLALYGRRSLAGMTALACVLLLLAVLASLLLGAGDVGPVRALAVLLGAGDEEARFVVGSLRLPRTLIGIGVGLALAVFGALLQAVSRNPLAEPGLLGVSAEAAFAVGVALWLGASTATLRVAVGQLGALFGCAAVLSVVRLLALVCDPERWVQVGAELLALLASLTALLLLLDLVYADDICFWVIGSLSGRRLEDLLAVMPSLTLALG